ncbi:MAG: DUF4111 domain-containing protein [Anaerolineae bacterium]
MTSDSLPLALPADAQRLIRALQAELSQALQRNLVGLYLSGSAVRGLFNPYLSDLDVTCVVRRPLGKRVRQRLGELIRGLSEREPYGRRLECVIAAREQVNRDDPSLVVDYVAEGQLRPEPLGHRWPIYRQSLRESGIGLTGPSPAELFAPASWETLQEAIVFEMVRTARLLDRPLAAADRLLAATNLPRLLYGLRFRRLATRLEGLQWAQSSFPEEWQDLIQRVYALYVGQSHPGDGAPRADEVLAFYSWAMGLLPQPLYRSAVSEWLRWSSA